MNKYKEYVKNTLILIIGKFSSQIVSFLLLPLYTFKLATENYGYVDLIQTYISIIVPVILLQLDSAVFRFLVDCRKDDRKKNSIISNSIFLVVLLILFAIIISFVFKRFFSIQYYNLIIINIIFMIINMFVLAVARGNGNNKIYAVSCIISSFTNLIFNFIFILVLKTDARGILISMIISYLLGSIYVLYKERILFNIKLKKIDFKIIKNLLKYSIPMIPNVLSWWIVNVSDRTIIVYSISAAANGIYSISCKFSNILNSLFSVFNLSWQETISLHINDEDASCFISKMITNILCFFTMISCWIITLIPFVFNIVIGSSYIDAYKYIPLLLLGNIFNVLAGLFGGIYIAKKITKNVAVTTIISAILNIIINICLINKIGLYAACVSTIISYFIMVIYRYIDIKKYIKLDLNIKIILKYFIMFLIIMVLYYLEYKILIVVTIILTTYIYINDNKIIIKNIIDKIKLKFNIL